jgi:predicted RNA-binding Zn-ribbon protein involved in translation (DUF1610 family)
MPFMVFPSSCRSCGKILHNYRGLSSHLRHNQDAKHSALRAEWLDYKGLYHNTLTCRKCGSKWEINLKSDANKKRCPACSELRVSMGKRSYEKLPTTEPIRCDSPKSSFSWVQGDSTYLAVRNGIQAGVGIQYLMHKLSLTYKVISEITEDLLGSEGYREFVHTKRLETAKIAYTAAREAYQRLTPEEKALRIKARCGKSGSLETMLAKQLRVSGIINFVMNDWQAVPIRGTKVPREADIKVSVDLHRKLVILCDGEAYHGPRTIHGDPKDRIQLDTETTDGYYSLGYSVIRYSETEIKSGFAIEHLLGILELLRVHKRIYRNWCPLEERVE